MSKPKKKKERQDQGGAEAMPTPFTVTVTPHKASGEFVECDISGPSGDKFRVDGGVIFLTADNAFDITFELEDGDLPTLKWADDPLWIASQKCPRERKTDAPFHSPAKVTGKKSQVAVDSNQQPDVLHYRMNFVDGHRPLSCDPVIIYE